MRTRMLFAALLAAGLLSGCTQPGGMAANGPPAVPPLRPEVMPKPPVSGQPLVWQPGHWDWTGSTYAWQPGEYVPAAGHGNLWMPGYWSQSPSGWQWQAPHWTS